MLIRSAIFLVLFYCVYKVEFLWWSLEVLVSPLAIWFFIGGLIWQGSLYIRRHLVLAQLGPMPSSGRAVVVTGCDTGFGHMLALELNKLGYYVFAGCLRPDAPESQSLMSKAKYLSAMDIVPLDVTSSELIKEMKSRVISTMAEKGLKLYALVNNAGIMTANSVLFEEEPTAEDFELQMNVNFYGVVRVTRAFMPRLIEDKGRIVNLTSIAGRGVIKAGTAYCASKHAAVAFTAGLMLECGNYGISVSSVEPWFYKTGLVNSNIVLGKLIRQWTKLEPKLKQLLGNSAGQQLVNNVHYFLSSPYTVEPDLNDVVRALVDAVTSREPQVIYRVSSWPRAIMNKILIEFCPWDWQLFICSGVEMVVDRLASNVPMDTDLNRNPMAAK